MDASSSGSYRQIERGKTDLKSTRISILGRRGGGETVKKVIVIACLAALLLSATAALATEQNWLLLMRASSLTYTQAGTIVQAGTTTSSVDGKDSGDVVLTFNGANANAGIYRPDFPDIPPVYGSDKRAPIVAPQTKSWDILVGRGSTFLGTAVRFAWWAPTGTNDPVGTIGGVPYIYKIEVVRDPTGEHSSFVWTSNDPTGGTSTAPIGFIDWQNAPMVADKNAMIKRGIMLRFTAAPIPEPGSMLVLASGLTGLVGFAVRRRRA